MKKLQIAAVSVVIMLLLVGYVMAGDKPTEYLVEEWPLQIEHYGSTYFCKMNGTAIIYDTNPPEDYHYTYDLEGYCGPSPTNRIWYVHYVRESYEKFEADLSQRTLEWKESYEMMESPGGPIIATYKSQSKWNLEPEAPGPHN